MKKFEEESNSGTDEGPPLEALRLHRSSMSRIEGEISKKDKKRYPYRRSNTQPQSRRSSMDGSLSSSAPELSLGGFVMAYTFLSKAKRISRASFIDREKQLLQEKPSGRELQGDLFLSDTDSDAAVGQSARSSVCRSINEASHLVDFSLGLESRSDFAIFWEDMVIAKEKRFVNLLLVTVPFAVLSALCDWDDIWVFTLNFLAMIPLAALLGDFTEVAAAHVGQTLGGLLNATFGNAVEVVVSIQALRANQIRVVQASLMGSVLSNLLLVLGTCFLFGGLNRKEQKFNQTAAKANCSLLLLSSLSLVLPTPLGVYYDLDDPQVLIISRTVSVCLLFMYCQLLYFQMKTHRDLFEDDDDDEEAGMSMCGSIVGLSSITLIVAIFSGFLVDSIDGFTEQANLSKTFVGIILLPIIGNVVEHIAAVTVAVKDKMELAMGIAVGSGTQVSIFVIPATIVIGWMMGKEMTLLFPTFEIALYIMSILIVAHAVGQGSSNWLFGSMLVTTYFLVGVAFWYEVVHDYTDDAFGNGINSQ